MSKIKKYILNVFFSFSLNFFVLIFGFFLRRQFVLSLGIEITGLNSLFNNLISIFSLSELGIGAAISFLMYKPFKDNNVSLIKKLFDFFKKSYFVIGLSISLISFSFFPFLNILIESSINESTILLYYVVIVINTVSSYFFGFYKTILIADQNSRTYSKIHLIVVLIQTFIQFLLLFFLNSYLIYLISSILFTIVLNLAIRKTVIKNYPFLSNAFKEIFSQTERKELNESIFSMALHKFGSVVVTSTDNVLISYFVGLVTVGLYSNYLLLLETVKRFFYLIIDNLTPSIGNLVSDDNKEKLLLLFHEVTFFNFLLNYLSTFSIFAFTNLFISLWLGEGYSLPFDTFIYICAIYYLNFGRRSNIVFIDATGIFKDLKFKSIAEGFINLFFSFLFILVFELGLNGVILGTLVSTIIANIFIEPVYLFIKCFKKGMHYYFLNFFFNLLFTFLSLSFYYFLFNISLFNDKLVDSLLSFFIIFLISFPIIIIYYYRKKEFKGLLMRIVNVKKSFI
jgi:O-antigen/teichoic acid export membrane protein